ncbi:transcription factor bHLH162 isoform X2 [Arachis hypogaea]|uniref:transcription factor bHLH162 isoform X2 n=1 Tax=Arachis hypogaea TaxID=3818 RepID=UPI000DEC7D60|nr:transcription factor bHLH162 isoform X2 [Arachis hypogaea]
MKKAISTSNEPSKLDRKTIERNRRIHMKSLCFKLTSLIPPNHRFTQYSKSKLDLAARYIKHMRERIEELKKQKQHVMMESKNNNNNTIMCKNIDTKLPLLELREFGSGIEVVLVCGLRNKTFMLYEVINVLEEEGAEVVTASFSTVGDKIFYILHAQDKISRVGVETSRVHQRLQEFIAPIEMWD